MIRKLLKSIAINSLGIYLSTVITSGLVSFAGDFKALISTGFVFVLVNALVKPIVNLLLLPIHIITLGTFRWITNLILLYIITRLVPEFVINSYVSSKIDLGFISIPPVYFSQLGSYLLATFILSLIFQFLYWLFED